MGIFWDPWVRSVWGTDHMVSSDRAFRSLG